MCDKNMENVVFPAAKHDFCALSLYSKKRAFAQMIFVRPRGPISCDVATGTVQNTEILSL